MEFLCCHAAVYLIQKILSALAFQNLDGTDFYFR